MAKFEDLVDLTRVQKLAEANYKMLQMPLAIMVAGEMTFLAGSGGQDLCHNFFLSHPHTRKLCQDCHEEIQRQMAEGRPCGLQCPNGLWNIGIPIMMEGGHLATLFIGQFLYENEEPERKFFLNLAEFCGFNTEEYLAALARVPRFSRGRVETIVEYNLSFAAVIAGLAENHDHLQRELRERHRDITEQKKTQDALHKRLQTLTSPIGDASDLRFEDLFDLAEVQAIQDAFADATGVASIITDIDGRPITRPSRFCNLCQNVIRKTEKGLANCIHSDAELGKMNPNGPIVRPCLSGGLWDGGTSICVGDRHVANWLIGQVLDEECDTEAMVRYARTIGADEEAFRQDLAHVTLMPREQFEKICSALFLIAKQLSLLALKNVQQSREITRRINAEAERRKLELQIQHAQKLESLGVLAGGIAHDFNNLLMAILGHADLAFQDLSPVSPVRENLREIEKASRRAAGLCQQMLAYSGRGKFVIQVVDLGEVVEEMTHMLEVSISKKVVMRFNFTPHLPPVEADVTQLRQVIMNLIINASEAIGDRSGIIAISTGAMECDRAYLSETWIDDSLPTGFYVYLEVADTGCGMERSIISKIFDPFFTTKFTGRGLGLAAVLGIVRGHHGTIKVYSEPGKGTTFKILLPASRRPVKRLRGDGSAPQGWRGSGTVLLVDDEETIRALGKRMLERFGFSVLMACDGREALHVFEEHRDHIACVLLDLTMPHMDGEEAFRELRRIRPDIRIILSSGYNEQEVSQRFLGKGLAGFIQKPYQLASLEQILKQVLG